VAERLNVVETERDGENGVVGEASQGESLAGVTMDLEAVNPA